MGAMEVFRWLVEEARGVWLISLDEPGVADHCMVVDTSVALIFYSSSRNAI